MGKLADTKRDAPNVAYNDGLLTVTTEEIVFSQEINDFNATKWFRGVADTLPPEDHCNYHESWLLTRICPAAPFPSERLKELINEYNRMEEIAALAADDEGPWIDHQGNWT